MTDHHSDGAPGVAAELLRSAPPPMARELPGFDAGRAPAAPGRLFVAWLAEALDAGAADPQVMTLSTVDAEGLPDARVLVLRDVDEAGGGWMFAADAASPKGRQLAGVPAAAMTVYWPAVGRQVRLRGPVETAPRPVAEADFASRSPLSRAATLVGRQSEPLGSAEQLAAAAEDALHRIEAEPGASAPGHTVYVLRAETAEFWQGDPERRHVRLRYRRRADGGGWDRSLLWP
ncbi:hypothetical protein BIV57_04405 [Mangrovactinospora gilvigrisea]|uniref:Oxidase n=1 Tax=Mangrovactinospora gilvigrisea TaxID=1428644 RepID=A0A1J7CB02_9ACTN|nr:pyridoxal 5'-phosphate synthase [Mangrovactinospora gilvigrisea]OIV38696.1 hypothetical protein BIV57_04405 [Mangrovactinospora gilvigrisea]